MDMKSLTATTYVEMETASHHFAVSNLENFAYLVAMPLLERFLDPSTVSLKICGVTTRSDADRLIALGVDAIGVNFWSQSKRYLAPHDAAWLRDLAGKILRVGVFVNADYSVPIRLYNEGLIDVIQLHGDERPADATPFHAAGAPMIKAIGVNTYDDLTRATEYGATAILLDTLAPGVYGGTGETFDWNVASEFRARHHALPVILAGGIIPSNAAHAVESVRPAALDIASGAEISPGIKDFKKISEFLTILGR